VQKAAAMQTTACFGRFWGISAQGRKIWLKFFVFFAKITKDSCNFFRPSFKKA
jgi:hypothetical protein